MLVGAGLIIGLPGWLILVIGSSWTTTSGAVEETQVGDDD